MSYVLFNPESLLAVVDPVWPIRVRVDPSLSPEIVEGKFGEKGMWIDDDGVKTDPEKRYAVTRFGSAVSLHFAHNRDAIVAKLLWGETNVTKR